MDFSNLWAHKLQKCCNPTSGPRSYQNAAIQHLGPKIAEMLQFPGPEIAVMLQSDFWAQKLRKCCNFWAQKLRLCSRDPISFLFSLHAPQNHLDSF